MIAMAIVSPVSFGAVTATFTQANTVSIAGIPGQPVREQVGTSSVTDSVSNQGSSFPFVWTNDGTYASSTNVGYSNGRGFAYAGFEISTRATGIVNPVVLSMKWTNRANTTLSGLASGTNVWYALSGKSPVLRISNEFFGKFETTTGIANASSSGTLGFTVGYILTEFAQVGGGSSINFPVVESYSFAFTNLQFSLLGPVGSQQSPFMQVPQPLPYESDQAQRGENVTGYQLGFGLGQSGLGRDEFLWTSSNPADLIPDAGVAARSLAFNPTELELVYDITGPRATAVIFDALLASIVPILVLEIGGVDVPVTLGQEIDLTTYNPAGLNKFNLRISGIPDWSVLPNDWLLTGYKFAGPGEVEVVTVAVPEVSSWALASLGLLVLGCRLVHLQKRRSL
jgi:hypothetical protein